MSFRGKVVLRQVSKRPELDLASLAALWALTLHRYQAIVLVLDEVGRSVPVAPGQIADNQLLLVWRSCVEVSQCSVHWIDPPRPEPPSRQLCRHLVGRL